MGIQELADEFADVISQINSDSLIVDYLCQWMSTDELGIFVEDLIKEFDLDWKGD